MNLTLQTKDVTFSLFYVPKSHTDKLYRNSDRKWVDIEHFKIVIMEHNNTYNRSMSEVQFIRQYYPSLNMQDNSIPPELFNLSTLYKWIITHNV